jgi:beta-lactam-binding protein with PASTA domain
VYDLPLPAAEHVLSCHGFDMGAVTPNPPPDGWVVVSTSPPAEQWTTPKNYKIKVRLAQMALVPNLVGRPPAVAQTAVSPLGFIIDLAPAADPPATAVIAWQYPAADTPLQAGNEVQVQLGAAVPRVLRLTLAPAAARLKAAGFTVCHRSVPAPRIPSVRRAAPSRRPGSSSRASRRLPEAMRSPAAGSS